ncbi:OLC1v1002096C1 [Oldenlandia corymbosa var. corymbosa]|nr:OLC1v1002096C1 [Oldenlandia corymbosa var. corymbosa]
MDYFKNGDEIEISSNEEGFRGSWYSGTLIKKVKKQKVLVEYKTILANELGQKKLREELDVVLVRPPPPRESHCRFKLSDEVDAYIQDGWWEGVITEVLEDGRFAVYFRANGEQTKFWPSELRLHREWVDYQRWVPPLQPEEVAEDKSTPENLKPVKETVQLNFNQGAQVEVRSDEEGFEGAWLSATILRRLKKEKYMVQYQNFRNDKNTELLTEEADGRNIRPQPPKTEYVDCFKVLQKVDALYKDCWWTGMISKVLRGKKYVVYFHETQEKMEFKHGDLRQHQDWIDGKWIIPS